MFKKGIALTAVLILLLSAPALAGTSVGVVGNSLSPSLDASRNEGISQGVNGSIWSERIGISQPSEASMGSSRGEGSVAGSDGTQSGSTYSESLSEGMNTGVSTILIDGMATSQDDCGLRFGGNFASDAATLREALNNRKVNANPFRGMFRLMAKIKGQVEVNGKVLPSQSRPMTYNNRTMIPLRAVAEAMNATVIWDAETNVARVAFGHNVIEVPVDDYCMIIDDNVFVSDAPSVLMNGSTYVPIRAIATLLGAEVGYDDATGNITITSKTAPTVIEVTADGKAVSQITIAPTK